MLAFLIGRQLRTSKMTFRLSRDLGPFYLVVPHHLGLYAPVQLAHLFYICIPAQRRKKKVERRNQVPHAGYAELVTYGLQRRLKNVAFRDGPIH